MAYMDSQDSDRSILVVDTDFRFFESLQAEHSSHHFNLRFASTGKDAQSLISSSKDPFYGIFVNPLVAQPSGLSVVRCAFSHRPATPIYMILDEQTQLPFSPQDLRGIGVRNVLKKPMTLKDMLELVSPILIQFDVKKALENAPKTKETIGTELIVDDPAFISIRSNEFLSGTQSLFDVYVRLKSGRYLKLLQAGDAFSADRLQVYLNKGVANFYIRKEVQQTYLEYCDHLTSALIKHEKAPIELKTSQTLNLGEETMKFLRAYGISDKNLNYAAKFVKNVHDLTEQLNLRQQSVFDQFLSNIAAFEHGAGTCVLASLLAQELEIQMSQPVQIVGLASFFHDIGLFQLPENFWPENFSSEDSSQLTPDDKNIFQTHPERGAMILRGVRGIPSAASQAIEQHHMRIHGPSFPESLHSIKISRVAEMVGICDEFQRRILKTAEAETYTNLRPEMERKIFPCFSRQIVYAFRSAFFPHTLPGNS